jgi:hypothetical protein
MCIISQPVNTVSDTNILVAIDDTQTRQLVVYSNKVDNISDANAMILPVPNPTTVSFHNLGMYPNMFKDMSKAFRSKVASVSNSYSYSYSTNSVPRTLEVFNVGSYKVSLAKNLGELKLVDSRVFKLSDGCEDMLKDYPSGFGFIICKLGSGLEKYHPFGYSHDIVNKSSIFVPTKHYHSHVSMENYNRFSNIPYLHQTDEEWNHDIYLYNITGKAINDMSGITGQYFWNNTVCVPRFDFNFDSCRTMEKHTIRGNQDNKDLVLQVA